MPRKKAETKLETKQTTGRPSWKGQLNLGLVSFSVEATNAFDRQESDIHFHQLHAKCHSRIHYEKVCPKHGKVSSDEIVKGYEVSKGKYVEFDSEELDELQNNGDKVFTIDAFVSPETIDPLYFDGRMYYLRPADNVSQDAFDLVVTAMEQQGQYGIGEIVLSGKNQLALIRPMSGLLHMAMLNYSKEIRSPEPRTPTIKKTPQATRQLKLAQSLIQEWSDDNFDFTQYEDTHRARVEELIDAKIKGKTVTAPAEEKAPTTVNLMDALRKSLDSKKSGIHSHKGRKSGSA